MTELTQDTKNKTPFPINHEQIDRVVDKFYAKIRVHPSLGPIFNGIVGTSSDLWGFHEDKIRHFWRHVLLHEGNLGINLMATHIEIPEIRDAHFTQWLDLFDGVLHEELPAETAQLFSAKAHKIGDGLRRTVGIFNGLD